MDYQFLIVTLWRLRTAATIATWVAAVSDTITSAVAEFDRRLPDLARMRHVAQHLDDYAVDDPKRRRQRKPDGDLLVGRRALQVGAFGEDGFSWLDGTINVVDIRAAAAGLYSGSARRARDPGVEFGGPVAHVSNPRPESPGMPDHGMNANPCRRRKTTMTPLGSATASTR